MVASAIGTCEDAQYGKYLHHNKNTRASKLSRFELKMQNFTRMFLDYWNIHNTLFRVIRQRIFSAHVKFQPNIA